MKKAAAIVLYCLAACLAGYHIYLESSSRYLIGIPEKLGIALLIGICFFLPTVLCMHWNPKKKKQYLRVFLYIMFGYYIWILMNMLLFDAAFGRGLRWDHALPLEEYWQTSTNFKPFFTIRNYLQTYWNGNISGRIVAVNVLGNLLAFAPFGVFLPVLFPRMRQALPFLGAITGAVCFVELLQLLTRLGSCDIDDLILNLAGAAAVYFLMRIPPLRRIRL